VVVVVLIVLWSLFQPGIMLEWSVAGGPLTGFRVYRAPVGSADSGLLGEVPAEAAVQDYAYLDARLWPGQQYVYRVEAVGAEGQAAASQAIRVDGLAALPAQVAILLASVMAGCAVVALTSRWRSVGGELIRLRA